jgi:hypothetical protein
MINEQPLLVEFTYEAISINEQQQFLKICTLILITSRISAWLNNEEITGISYVF